MNIIYQIYYDDATKVQLDPLAIPYQNLVHTDYFENDVIMDVHNHNGFFGDYCGVLSPRFKEKTGNTLQQVYDAMKEKPADIYILCHYKGEESSNFWKNSFGAVVAIKGAVNAARILPFTLEHTSWINAYCNYIICRPEVMIEYVNKVLFPVKRLFQTTRDRILQRLLATPHAHRDGQTSIIPYFMEGLWGSFIANSEYKYETLIKLDPVFL